MVENEGEEKELNVPLRKSVIQMPKSEKDKFFKDKSEKNDLLFMKLN
jgi:hypothetical protein